MAERFTGRAAAEAREAYEARKRLLWQYPSLSLHVYATAAGVRCHASVDSMDASGRLRRVEIAQASWRPREVSERLVVEWGQRALTAWLEREQSPVQDGSPAE